MIFTTVIVYTNYLHQLTTAIVYPRQLSVVVRRLFMFTFSVFCDHRLTVSGLLNARCAGLVVITHVTSMVLRPTPYATEKPRFKIITVHHGVDSPSAESTL